MKRNSGFTLVELLVVMAIVGVILGGLYSVFQTSSRSYVVQDRAVAMQQDARFGVDYLADLIRVAGYDPRGAGSNRFGFQVTQDWDSRGPQSCDGKNIAFTADDNQDGRRRSAGRGSLLNDVARSASHRRRRVGHTTTTRQFTTRAG